MGESNQQRWPGANRRVAALMSHRTPLVLARRCGSICLVASGRCLAASRASPHLPVTQPVRLRNGGLVEEEEELIFETSGDVEVVPTFDEIGLRDDLRGIYAYCADE